ncbi:hypothetical protein Cni_G11600 [Canna indica]|uniref:Uncharacterized protein n=1 Tax=Canna indica TaxID=4628 RepID=A0AAQ3QB05_9LILI|nr:hypothetical protein Cni_G11600 [Canna indica]
MIRIKVCLTVIATPGRRRRGASDRPPPSGSAVGEPRDELGPDLAVGGGADLRRSELGAAEGAGEVQLAEPAVEAVAVEDVAAGEAPDAVAVGQAAEADRALRAAGVALGRAGEEGEGAVGGEVVGEDDEAGEAGSDGRAAGFRGGVGGRGEGEGEGEEADEEGADVGDGGGGGGEEQEGDGIPGDVVQMIRETHSLFTSSSFSYFLFFLLCL